jgi:glycosyltransferase involved in cell wall biosynthesis
VPLRFCLVTSFYPPWSFGGDAIFVQRLARLLAAEGHEVTVVHSRDAYFTVGGGPVDEPEAAGDGVEVVAVDAGLGPVGPLATYLSGRPLVTGRALREVLERDFDVIHFHNPSLVAGPGGLAYGSALKLFTLHEQWLVCPTHVRFRNQRELCERETCVRCTLVHRRPPQLWRHGRLLERSLRHVDALLAPSRSTAALHARLAPHVRIEHLPSFAPDPGPPAAASSTRAFLYAGRLEPVKGVATLLDAFRERPGDELWIAGSGSQKETLREQARDLPNVRFLGHVSQDRLEEVYRGAHALLLPTIGHESFPLVLVEALAHGVPAVVRRRGALAEAAEDSGAALTYASPAELHACLDRLATDDALRAELGRRGRETYERSWTPQAHLEAYLALVERLSGRERLAVPVPA